MHNNVKVCTTIRVLKYISKYIPKYQDCIKSNCYGKKLCSKNKKKEDERGTCLLYKWSLCFNVWSLMKMLEFKLYGLYSLAQILMIQSIYFNDKEREQIIERNNSNLTEFMKINHESSASYKTHTIFYLHFPEN